MELCRVRAFVVVAVLAVAIVPPPAGAAPDAGGEVVDEVTALLCQVLGDLGLTDALDCDGDGYSAAQGDCEDADPTVYPGAPHRRDGKDNDCDGTIDADEELDADGDGVTPGEGDCDDGNPAVEPGAADDPDIAMVDANCDGIDGTEASAVFVSIGGSNTNPGTRAQPKRTIAAGIALAAPSGKDVYVTGGTFTEGAGIALVDNTGIYGSYRADWTRSTSEITRIEGTPQAALADGDTGVLLQLLTLAGSAPAAAGTSAYGLRAINGSSLTLQGVVASAGNGVGGAVGGSTAPGSPGLAAVNGAGGSCDDEITVLGGPGGAGPGFVGGTGGTGGKAASGGAGAAGGGPSGGGGGIGGAVGNNSNGKDGSAGAPGGGGAPGGAGAGATNAPAVDGAVWTGRAGGTGSNGSNGSGGGGGGGGGGQTGFFVNDGTGNGGGGGGAGGTGGAGGPGGAPGGGSFGVYLWDSTLIAEATTIAAGNGGLGGAGASGGSGGPGGNGGLGGSVCLGEVGRGGNGGNGGNGGAGGAGGGGAGGPSIGLYRGGSSSATLTGSPAPAAGNPGAGGSSPAGGSSVGATGIAASTYP